MLADRFGINFSHNGLINSISWPYCHIFIALSINSQICYSMSHMAMLWPNMTIWLYSHMALWPIWVSKDNTNTIQIHYSKFLDIWDLHINLDWLIRCFKTSPQNKQVYLNSILSISPQEKYQRGFWANTT